eukprot:5090260-Pyramimonas_sp.AAC.1
MALKISSRSCSPDLSQGTARRQSGPIQGFRGQLAKSRNSLTSAVEVRGSNLDAKREPRSKAT